MTGVPPLRVMRPGTPAAALGFAVQYLMTKPAFANLRFGDWSKILVGQINRGHYCFVADDAGRIQGFLGWALTSEAKAEAWLAGRAPLSHQDSLEGDCVVINAWMADSRAALRVLLREARKLGRGRTYVCFKRYDGGGAMRPVRLRLSSHGHAPTLIAAFPTAALKQCLRPPAAS